MGSRRVVPPTKPQFFKPFLPGSERELSIPDAFFTHLKGKNCDKAVLRNANGKTWHVKINGWKLLDGWKEFVSDHDLYVGDFLVFRHEGNMLFDVMIFDQSTCEREYTSTTLSQIAEEVENGTPNQEGTEKMFSGLRKAKREAKAEADPPTTKKQPTFDIKAASLSIRNPYFVAPVVGSIGGRYQLNVPSKFARMNGLTRKRCDMILEDERGKPWPMSLRPAVDRGNIANGWCRFAEAKCLKAGNVVILELVKNEKKLVMKFHGYFNLSFFDSLVSLDQFSSP